MRTKETLEKVKVEAKEREASDEAVAATCASVEALGHLRERHVARSGLEQLGLLDADAIVGGGGLVGEEEGVRVLGMLQVGLGVQQLDELALVVRDAEALGLDAVGEAKVLDSWCRASACVTHTSARGRHY